MYKNNTAVMNCGLWTILSEIWQLDILEDRSEYEVSDLMHMYDLSPDAAYKLRGLLQDMLVIEEPHELIDLRNVLFDCDLQSELNCLTGIPIKDYWSNFWDVGYETFPKTAWATLIDLMADQIKYVQ